MSKRRKFLVPYTRVIPAGQTVGPIAIEGTQFICKESDGTFGVEFDSDSQKLPCEVGMTFAVDPDDEPFNQVTLYNDTAADIAVTFFVGTRNVKDQRLNTLVDRTVTIGAKEPTTNLVGTGILTLLAGLSTSYNGVSSGPYRKYATVQNLDATNSIQILDSANRILAVVPVGQAYPILSNATFKVKNPTGVSVIYCVALCTYVA